MTHPPLPQTSLSAATAPLAPSPAAIWLWLADAVLVLHMAVVAFVVVGVLLFIAGHLLHWRWTRRRALRYVHLGAIVYVAAQAWFGVTCPLTTLEVALRKRGGGAAYAGSFVEHWVSRLLYWHAPSWVFTAGYTAFAILVALVWWRCPPEPRSVNSN